MGGGVEGGREGRGGEGPDLNCGCPQRSAGQPLLLEGGGGGGGGGMEVSHDMLVMS